MAGYQRTLTSSISEIIEFIRKTLTVACSAVVYFFPRCRLPWTRSMKDGQQKTVRNIPGPTAVPILGTTWLFLFGSWKFNKMHLYTQYLYKKYGRVVKEEALFNVPIINVFDREDIEKVMKCHSKYPIRPQVEALAYYRRSRPDRYVSVGLVNEQGEAWHFLRQSLTPELISPKTVSNFLPQIEEIAQDWCYLIKHQRDEHGNVKNMEELAGRLGLEISCALVLGRRMGFLLVDVESEKTRRFEKAVQNHFIATRDTYFGLPFWKLFNTKSYRTLVESEETIYELASYFISTTDDSSRESVVFQSVLKANLDEKEKTAAIIDFIAAGIHTLKNSILFALHLVANDVQIQEKIVEDETRAYSKACVTESFRYITTTNALARVSDQDLVLGGYNVKAGSVIICQTGIACRSEDNFKNADEFRPERWLDNEKYETVSKSTYIYAPFGAGRRICPGKRFIEQVLPILLQHTVKNFTMSVSKPLDVEFEFLLAPKPPVVIHFQERF